MTGMLGSSWSSGSLGRAVAASRWDHWVASGGNHGVSFA
jgi:hypothetical protein